MYAKIQITGKIEVVTGMHIGGSSAFAAIGAVDSPVIKDVRTNLPMIPGSSLKGKMRTLLAKTYNGNGKMPAKPDDDDERLIRLFGSAKKERLKRSRIIISDMVMCNDKELREQGLQSMTEVKFENSINRLTAVANPRQIERAVRGSQFDIDFIYEVEEENEIVEDFETLSQGMKLLQYDYLGGHGSRGYGKVKFNDLQADVVIGEVSDEIMADCNEKLKGV
ncbi:MAG: type III-A CRISPR-associated RAMP protein Csm3 [Lachnospira sp.]|nr:type III-A CRISPR-associated RAMP protein Csm3 [Lachnospira sp.]